MNKFLFKLSFILLFTCNLYAKDSVFNVPLTNIPKLNPYIGNDLNMNKIMNQIATTLVSLDESLSPIPKLAKSWSINSKNNCINFNLQQNSKFHDGTEITSKEIFDILKESLRSGSDLTSQIKNFKDCSSVSKCDGFQVKDRNNFSLCLIGSNFDLLLRKLAGVEGSIVKFKGGQLIGSGPYLLKEVRNDYVLLERNDSFAKIDQIKFIKINQDTALKKFKENELDIISNSEFDIKGLDGFIKQQYSAATFGIVFNIKSGVFKDVKTRKLISGIIDKSKFASLYGMDVAEANSLIPKGFLGHSFIKPEKYALKDFKPLKLKATIALRNKYKNNNAIEYLIKTFNDAGINLVPVYGTFQELLNGFRAGKFDLILKGDAPRFYEPSTSFVSFISDQYSNISGYKNSALDQLYYNYEKLKTNEDKIDSLVKMESIIREDVPVIPLFHPVFTTWFSSKVKVSNLKSFSIKFWDFPFYSYSKL